VREIVPTKVGRKLTPLNKVTDDGYLLYKEEDIYKDKTIISCDHCKKNDKWSYYQCNVCRKDYCLDCKQKHLGYDKEIVISLPDEDDEVTIYICKECIDNEGAKTILAKISEIDGKVKMLSTTYDEVRELLK
jgi:hypothetical protein